MTICLSDVANDLANRWTDMVLLYNDPSSGFFLLFRVKTKIKS